MGVNSLPKTVTRQRRDCELNPGPSAPEFSPLTTRLPSHHGAMRATHLIGYNSGGEFYCSCGLRSRFSTRSCTYGTIHGSRWLYTTCIQSSLATT